MRLSRRKTLHFAGSIAATSGLSGCLGFFRRGTVSLLIENGDDQQHTLNVIFEKENETVFSNQYDLEAGAETETPDAVEAGEYSVQATLETTAEETLDFHMNGCTDNSLSVSIDESGKLQLGITTVCD